MEIEDRTRATPSAYREFMASWVWKDFKRELEIMRRGIVEQMLEPEVTLEIADFHRAQGRYQVITDIIDTPEVLQDRAMQQLEAEQDAREANK